MTEFLVASAVSIASMLLVARVAISQGRRARPWIWTAAIVGPLALAMLCILPRIQSVGR